MTAIIILAAGSSSRLGRAKQQLVFKGKTLLKHSVDEAIKSGCSPVLVILGATEQAIRKEVDCPEIQIKVNEDWQAGISTSIKTGIAALLSAHPNAYQAIITVCDQPYIDHKLLEQLIAKKQSSKCKVVACAYDETLGTPVLFDKSLFSQLLELKGSEGAKKLIYSNLETVESIQFALGGVDIDTVADYEQLIKKR